MRRWLKVPYGKPYVLIGKQSQTASEELKKKLDSALEKVKEEEVIIGLLDESIVADCTGKSRVINTKEIKTLNTYRSKRLFSYFGCLCLGGKSVVKAAKKCKKEDCWKFLKELRQANREKIMIIILDNAQIHKAKIVQEFCQENKIILVYLPPYSPNLNPIEFMWKDLKKRLSEYYQENVENLNWTNNKSGAVRVASTKLYR